MIRHPIPIPRQRTQGLTLVESVFAAALLGLLAVATLTAAGQAAAARLAVEEQSRGRDLGHSLLAEICTLPYEDESATGVLGPEAGESNAGADRLTLNDVDDYDGLTEPAPQDRSGAALDNCAGWRREVEVSWIDVSDPSQMAASETGVKWILVQVYHGSKMVCRVSAVRARAWDEMQEGR